MEGQRMGFPLAYGYCLVGRVTECGDDVDDSMYGRLVFTFAAHASEVVTKAGSVQLVPEGIDPLDAIFMPSVETALSIVHDAHPRLGEKIVVYGQGLIGLLVTSLLSLSALNLQLPSLTTVDTLPERLALSALLGSQQAVLPTEVAACNPFDVAIEASGNYRALQSAIDCTRNGGRIIIASWYGNEDVSLKLDIDFHRSHKTMRTSQVSDLPAELRQTWTKQRRFDLVWEVLRDMKPSRLLTKKAAPSDAKKVYEELSRGEQVSVAFDYTNIDA
jgi:threonine dehydrogenase-like Zn-dependent dehydrogenase